MGTETRGPAPSSGPTLCSVECACVAGVHRYQGWGSRRRQRPGGLGRDSTQRVGRGRRWPACPGWPARCCRASVPFSGPQHVVCLVALGATPHLPCCVQGRGQGGPCSLPPYPQAPLPAWAPSSWGTNPALGACPASPVSLWILRGPWAAGGSVLMATSGGQSPPDSGTPPLGHGGSPPTLCTCQAGRHTSHYGEVPDLPDWYKSGRADTAPTQEPTCTCSVRKTEADSGRPLLSSVYWVLGALSASQRRLRGLSPCPG